MMPDSPSDLARSLVALPELGLRVAWLLDWTSRSAAPTIAHSLDATLGRSIAGDARAKESALPIALLLARNYEAPWLEDLRKEADARGYLSLGRVLERAGPGPELDFEIRVPKYGPREVTLGERRSMARRPSRLQIEKLILDPDPGVIRQLLLCSSLREEDVLLMAARRPTLPPLLETIVASDRWMARTRIRNALILNPYAPLGLVFPLILTLTREDLNIVARAMSINPLLRRAATELVQRLPPLSAPPSPFAH